MSEYLTLDEIDTEAEYYGVPVAHLGEDGERILAFTHDRRRAIAAACALVRRHDQARPTAANVGDPTWMRVTGNCGCGDACKCPLGDDGYTDHDECPNYGLPPCYPDTYAWMTERCAADAPNAIPAIVLEVESW